MPQKAATKTSRGKGQPEQSKGTTKAASAKSTHTASAGKTKTAGAAKPRESSKPKGKLSNTTTDHEEIRQWAEERGAHPACVRGTGKKKGDIGMIRLDFPGFSGENSLEEISWDEWFKAFDKNKLALIYQEQTAEGEKSNFNKLVSREEG
jgi:hypothetical protein